MPCWPSYLSVCVCVCQSIHLYLSQLIHSLYHVHISSRSLCHFYPSTPAPPCPAMRSMCGALPTICAGSTSVYSPQTYWARERSRDGGREELCATKIQGYVTSEHSLPDSGSTQNRITSQLHSHLDKMQMLPPLLPPPAASNSSRILSCHCWNTLSSPFFFFLRIHSRKIIYNLVCKSDGCLWFE